MSFQLTRYSIQAAIAAFSLAVIAGCGGGGSDATGTTTATGSTSTTSPTVTAASTTAGYTEGTLAGFGSIIVNGVRFDDSSATVVDDFGSVRSASSLKLGMQVSVDSSSVDKSSATARASRVRFGSELVGPVEAVSASAGTLTVLGQPVDVTSSTVFDDSLASGLAGVSTGAVIEVHGLRDSATGRWVATRIEAESAATAYKLTGTVASLDTTAKTFKIGGVSLSYAGLATVPSTLADGVTVRAWLSTTATSGVWTVTSLRDGTGKLPSTASEAHVRGRISAFTSASSFTVNGIAVEASGASFPDGSTGLALGVAVEVEGTVTNGVLVATKVEIESRHSSDSRHQFRLHGTVGSLDATAKTFVVRGVTVDYSGSISYEKGDASMLVNGAKVRVEGTVGANRNQLTATTIRFED